MNDKSLDLLYDLLYTYSCDLEELYEDNNDNYNKIVAISNALEDIENQNINEIVIDALKKEAKVLDDEDQRLKMEYYRMTDKIKDLIEEIVTYWW